MQVRTCAQNQPTYMVCLFSRKNDLLQILQNTGKKQRLSVNVFNQKLISSGNFSNLQKPEGNLQNLMQYEHALHSR